MEEYKICAEVLNNVNRLSWTRYTVHLAIVSGLLTIWTFFIGLAQPLQTTQPDQIESASVFRLALLAVAVAGLVVTVA